jgi:predicted RNase H-like nuclease (RuvC/YqgF family)
MNNIVKIVLVLNILAGGAGIFFGYTKSGKVDAMKKAKVDAEGKAQTASASERKLKNEKDAALTASSTKDGTISNLETQLEGLKGDSAQAKALIDQANSAAQLAQAAAAKANSDLQLAQQMAGKVPGLEGKLTDYENLGTLQEIKDRLDRLTKLEVVDPSGPKKPKKPKQVSGGEIGTIQSHDPQNDFYVINVGSDNGVKKGDKFTIFSGGRAMGKIEISRTQPTVSIAVYQRGFPKPPTPFKSGDKVMKIN